jgi:hypothetical protein
LDRAVLQVKHAPPSLPHRSAAAAQQVGPEQQPPLQLAGQSLQTPETQSTPASQALHGRPATPHWVAPGSRTHWSPAQQPMHVAGLQVHIPLTHFCPSLHCNPFPQEHRPEGEQPSASIGPQVEHCLPPFPQVRKLDVWQTSLRQQPLGQEIASQ